MAIDEISDDDTIKANLNKLNYEQSIICLAINTSRRHFLIFNIDIANNQADINNQTQKRYKNKFQIEFANWLDKLTEGLNMNNNPAKG